MKKSIIFLFAVCFFAFANISTVNKANAQAVEQGSVIIDGFYGWPNLTTGILQSFYADGTFTENVKVGSIGPLGGRFEYLLSDNLGIGVDFIYAMSSVSWTEDIEEYNWDNDTYYTTTYNYEVSNQRIRIVPNLKYHFSQSDNVDFYGVFGIGYKSSTLNFTSDDLDWNHSVGISLSPVAFRMAVGTRFFFTPNIGMNMELGIGSALATGGISVKF